MAVPMLVSWLLITADCGACLAQSENANPAIGKKPPVRLGEPFVYRIVPASNQDSGQADSGDSKPAELEGERELRVYCTKPEDWSPKDKRPAIVFFHGGGWVGGAPGQFSVHARYFASRGLVCFQVEYRLLDRTNNDPPTQCIEDAVYAMKWVRRNANRFAIDSRRIASAGGSAGGQLAAYVGCVVNASVQASDEADAAMPVSAKSDAMLLFNPVYDNGPGGWGTKRVGDQYALFSPAHNITSDDPPNIVFLGSRDRLIPVETAERFREQCLSRGVESELIVYEGEGHGFFNVQIKKGRFYKDTVEAADRFLAKLGWITGEPTVELPVLPE